VKRVVWTLYRLLALGFCLFALILNQRLYSNPDSSPETIRPHLDFLKASLQSGAAERMQDLFPEGYLFTYELYGAAWVDLAIQHPEVRGEALAETRWALSALESEQGKAPFDSQMSLEYGVFYRGWTNWLRGGLLVLDPTGPESELFQKECIVLAQSLEEHGPYLDAYPSQAWPCDTTVAVACLALHDSLYPVRYQGDIQAWLERTGKGLFPHQVRPRSEPSRGTSQVMIQRFLFEIDPELASQQYEDFREDFVTTRFGLPGVREHPTGQDGSGDIDSGPLVFGFSFSATGVVPGAARLHRDVALLEPFGQLIHTFGFPVRGRYLGGVLPVADALLVWSRTAVSWTGKVAPERAFKPVVGSDWRWGFHLFWVVLVGIVLAPWVWHARRHFKPA
jgi:hypothetical protein